MAYLFVVSPSGGILQGDRYRTDLLLKNNAKAHITTQGATRVYSMDSNSASQIVNITVGENCYLEYEYQCIGNYCRYHSRLLSKEYLGIADWDCLLQFRRDELVLLHCGKETKIFIPL